MVLSSRNLSEKGYEELMQEALLQIPVYTKEWTNFNPSDPGITVLENLTAFQLVQQEQINTITDEIRKKLLKLVGCEQKKGSCARLLVKARQETGPYRISKNQPFHAGSLCFETNRMSHVGANQIIGLFADGPFGIADLSHVIRREDAAGITIFGDNPQAGQSLYIVTDGMEHDGEELIVYAEMEQRAQRTLTDGRKLPGMAVIEWQCYTQEGFTNIKSRDATGGFLVSGAVRFCLPKKVQPAVYDGLPVQGYVLKGSLKKADYDMLPRMKGLHGFLLELWQKETKAAVYQFRQSVQIDLHSALLEQGYFKVFCREEKDADYRLYEPAGNGRRAGRFVEILRTGYGQYRFRFSKKKYQYGPAKVKQAICIAVYQESLMKQYDLGYVAGYDEQVIALPAKHIVPGSFAILAKRSDGQGEDRYTFLGPDRTGEDTLHYTLLEEEGRLIIHDAGAFAGARLYVAALCVSEGYAGNIRAHNQLTFSDGTQEFLFENPCEGQGGRFGESLEEAKKRFFEELQRVHAAVTTEDYERIVKETPGLCIKKVKAIRGKQDQQVNLIVMPYSEQPFPILTEEYQRIIRKHLEARRMLTTKISLQSPVYLPIDVNAVVSVKAHYEHCREEILETIAERLDYIHDDKELGQLLAFDELFLAVEGLHCVESIQELTVLPRHASYAAVEGLDIRPLESCLCYPGRIELVIKNRYR